MLLTPPGVLENEASNSLPRIRRLGTMSQIGHCWTFITALTSRDTRNLTNVEFDASHEYARFYP